MSSPWLKNGKKIWLNGQPIWCNYCPCDKSDSSSSNSSSSGTSNCHLKFTADDSRYPTGAEGHYYPSGDPHSTSTIWTCQNGNYMRYEERWVVGIPYYRWWVYYISTESEEWVSTEVGSALPDDDPTTWVSPHCGLGDLVNFHACYVCEDESSSSQSSSSQSSSSSSSKSSSSSGGSSGYLSVTSPFGIWGCEGNYYLVSGKATDYSGVWECPNVGTIRHGTYSGAPYASWWMTYIDASTGQQTTMEVLHWDPTNPTNWTPENGCASAESYETGIAFDGSICYISTNSVVNSVLEDDIQ